MLYLVNNLEQQVQRHAGDLVRGFVFRNFVNFKHDKAERTKVYGDDPQHPAILLAHYKGSLMVVGDPGLYLQVWRDIFKGELSDGSLWQSEVAIVDEEKSQGRRTLFCNTTPLAFWEAAAQAGLILQEATHGFARLWYLEGGPRFAQLVKHPCRLGVGEELVDLLVQGISYDEDGYYVRQCVKHGPSFVSEIEGEPVCWSGTHLTGTLAMVYTPEQHRRKGYARSLGAFHIDYVLRQQGLAVCHVIEGNSASEKMMASFGFSVVDDPLVWRNVYWPL